jgi:hypothetical protein
MSEKLVALSGEVEGPNGGSLLAINPGDISYIETAWVKDEPVLRVYLGGRLLSVPEAEAAGVLEALGLGELVEDLSEDE